MRQLRCVLALVVALAALPTAARERAPAISVEAAAHGRLAAAVAPVRQAGWGKAWPFVAEHAWLVCVPQLKELGRFVVVSGRAFALNGASETAARRFRLVVTVDGHRSVPKTLDDEMPGIDAIWRQAPRPAGLPASERWFRVPIHGFASEMTRLGC